MTPCKESTDPLWHGTRPYRWCATHNRLMLTCEFMRKGERGRISLGELFVGLLLLAFFAACLIYILCTIPVSP